MPSERRLDPERKSRIVDATLEVIARDGVSGATHRRIAAVADVPLGSMTYHFDGIEHLLEEAFTRFALSISVKFDELLGAAKTPEQAQEAVADVICGDFWSKDNGRVLTLCYELYAYASRNPSMKSIMQDWMSRSQRALSQHFDTRTAIALDALIEGLTIHRSVEREPTTRAEVLRIIRLIVEG
ncbi:TetR/AcrR family transcriptional regulator [Pseudomonas asuensis]|uniref:TetR family transcriptional regulator n=1 Tax=Pseudomonas asuensis TaxID=1825787 RepID=A0ABQ2GYZ2_9PSED|nr:TetR family transcriptional regulator [Pseudomonas asuensis]GGM18925.1 TetR family transcriptional regulator [Pseudomonas asuensis]